MSVQIQPDWERPKFSFGKSTPEQAKAALQGYTAYFGTYSVDEKTATLTHHRAGNSIPEIWVTLFGKLSSAIAG